MEYEVIIREISSEHLAGVRGTYPVAQLPEVMGREFGRVMAALSAEGVQLAGGAVAVYHGWTEDSVDVEIGFTIHGVFFPQDRRSDVKPGRVPGGKVVFATHVGPYDQLVNAYTAIQDYAAANRLELAGVMWERYLTDPSEEPDPNKHVTEVYWPVVS